MILEISIPTLHKKPSPLRPTVEYIGKIEGIKKYQATKALKPLINSSKTLPQRVRQNTTLNRMSFLGGHKTWRITKSFLNHFGLDKHLEGISNDFKSFGICDGFETLQSFVFEGNTLFPFIATLIVSR